VIEHTASLNNDLGFISYPVEHLKLLLKEVLEDQLVIITSPDHPLTRKQTLEEIRAGRLTAIPLSDSTMIRKYYMVHHKDKYLSEPLQSFIDGVFKWAAEYLRELR